jgi:hypothetical protein
MRRRRQLLLVLPILFGMENGLAAQTLIEHGTASSASAIAAGPARNVGRSASGVARKLDSVLSNAPAAAPAMSNSRNSGSPGRQFFYTRVKIFDAFASPDSHEYENPRSIRTGMSANDELISRFGPPVLQITGGPNAKSWTFSRRENIVQLDMQGEKVNTVDAMNPQQSAVTLPVGHGFQTGH